MASRLPADGAVAALSFGEMTSKPSPRRSSDGTTEAKPSTRRSSRAASTSDDAASQSGESQPVAPPVSLRGETREQRQQAAIDFAIAAARMMRDDKCEEVLVLDVRGLSPIADVIVIGSGTSERQMRSVLDHIEELGQSSNHPPVRTSADERAAWLLGDFGDVVMHLFEPATRAHYDLETLWGDAPRIAWERPDQISRDHAGLSR